MKIRIIITGGTFDKDYDKFTGSMTLKESHLPEILQQIRCSIPITLEMNQLLDSLEMKEQNRRSILHSCQQSPEDHIVITHGTDTMVETARFLGESRLKKTILLTGAMIPYAVTGSDAMFNIGCAISAVQLLAPDVYIAMNGCIFHWSNARKDRDKGVFIVEPEAGSASLRVDFATASSAPYLF